jgi:hypothetical protein
MGDYDGGGRRSTAEFTDLELTQGMRDRIKDLQLQLDTAILGFLSRQGWTYTSNTPGHYWYWRKEINGEVLLVGQRTALLFEGVVLG